MVQELFGVDIPDGDVRVAGAAVALLLLALVRASRRRRARPRRGGTGGSRASALRRPFAGEVWFAEVPFEDRPGSKDRPVLVLDVYGTTCRVARFTSQDRGARRDHAQVPHAVRGLDRASWADLRPFALPTAAFRRHVSGPDHQLVRWYRRAVAQYEG